MVNGQESYDKINEPESYGYHDHNVPSFNQSIGMNEHEYIRNDGSHNVNPNNFNYNSSTKEKDFSKKAQS